MTLRGKTAIVGIGEVPTRRTYPGRSSFSLCTEAARMAIADAGLTKQDLDGLVTRGEDVDPTQLAEYMGLHPAFCTGVTQHGASGAHSVVVAAAAINAGLANTVLCVLGGTRDPAVGGRRSNGHQSTGPDRCHRQGYGAALAQSLLASRSISKPGKYGVFGGAAG